MEAASAQEEKVISEQSSNPIDGDAITSVKEVENVDKVSMTATDEFPTQAACEEISLEDLQVAPASATTDSIKPATGISSSKSEVLEPEAVEPLAESIAPELDVSDLATDPIAKIESVAVTETARFEITGHTITDKHVVYYTIQTESTVIQRRYNDFKALYTSLPLTKSMPSLPSAYGSLRLIRGPPSSKTIKHREERFQDILDMIAKDKALYLSDAFQLFLKEEVQEVEEEQEEANEEEVNVIHESESNDIVAEGANFVQEDASNDIVTEEIVQEENATEETEEIVKVDTNDVVPDSVQNKDDVTSAK